MASVVCLGQIIIPFSLNHSISLPSNPEVVFLQRGSRHVHVWGAARVPFGDLNVVESRCIGALLGPVGSCSTRIDENGFTEADQSLIKLQSFVVSRNTTLPQLRGCVFSRTQDIRTVLSAFENANVAVTSIWNYNPNIFFQIPHLTSHDYRPQSDNDNRWLQPYLRLCNTRLQDHQLTALRFLKRNESVDDTLSEMWNRTDNNWIREYWYESEDEDNTISSGSILADDMGLGKTLTALFFILATSELAQRSLRSSVDAPMLRSTATLVICPLATLSNWENEIRIHFPPQTIPYCVFHGRERGKITREKLLSSMVVLTTYDMLGTSDGVQSNLPMIESLPIYWFRVVLDEAHIIRNPATARTRQVQNLKADFFLCLTGTPVQNRLADLQSLVQVLKLRRWSEEWVWKNCLIPQISVGSTQAIQTLNRLMERICLRRTKDVLLSLPPKIERAVVVHLSTEWQEISDLLHQTFKDTYGRLRTSEDAWNSGEFFRQLVMIRQFCNHPIFVREEFHLQRDWRWHQSAKLVHLVNNLKHLASQENRLRRAKAVIFSNYVAFLQILEHGLNEQRIKSTWLHGKMSIQQRDESLARFRGDPDCNVLLGSIAAAGVGIDLRCAENVYVMEPSWNPAMEEQAIDRLYRLGQTRPVNVYRYYVQGTLEMNIHQIQRRKGELAVLSVPPNGNEEYETAQLLMRELA